MIARPSSSLPGTVARAIFRARHAIATVAVTYGGFGSPDHQRIRSGDCSGIRRTRHRQSIDVEHEQISPSCYCGVVPLV